MSWRALGCREWEYSALPNASDLLLSRSQAIIANVAAGVYDALVEGCDSREMHRALFTGLVPDGHEYYAGHYRGSAFQCLEGYEVGVDGDPLVGSPPHAVLFHMDLLATTLRSAIGFLDQAADPMAAGTSAEEHLLTTVAVAARLFRDFLTIHPYANGNGHIARVLVWLVLIRFGYWPRKWTIEPRPPVSNYGAAISNARRGDPEALERLILESLA
jgi:hypothetical protein